MKYGNKNARTKLSKTQVEAIRDRHMKVQYMRRHLDKHHSISAIAADYGVSKRCIERLLAFETWN